VLMVRPTQLPGAVDATHLPFGQVTCQ